MAANTGLGVDQQDCDDEDAELSVTETVVEDIDSEKEYVVEDIRAEKMSGGVKKYLIEWSGFPFHECTWEPESNLTPVLQEMWDHTKAEIAAGLKPPFETSIQQFKEAKKTHRLKQANKRKRKNAKRIRLGMKPLGEVEHPPDSDFDDDEMESESSYNTRPPRSSRSASSDDEPLAEDEAQKADHAGHMKKAPLPPGRKHNSKGIAVRKPEAGTGRKSNINTIAAGSNASVRKGTIPAKSLGAPSSMTGSFTGPEQPASRPALGGRSATGYQGTARKASTDKAPTSSTVKLPAPSVNGRPGTGQVARKTAKPKKAAKLIGNVFADGTKRKPREKLESRAADITREQKPFRTIHLRRQAELRGRDRENSALPISHLEPFLFDPHKDSRDARPSSSTEAVGNKTSDPAAPASAASDNSISSDLRHPAPVPVPTPLHTALAAEAGTSVNRPKKKRKSVRFTDGEDPVAEPSPVADSGSALSSGMFCDEPEAMDLDDLAPPQDKSPSPGLGRSVPENGISDGRNVVSVPLAALPSFSRAPAPTAASRKLSLAEYQRSRAALHDVDKHVVIGFLDPPRTLELCFQGIPRESMHPWLAAFLSEQALQFGHVCLAKTFNNEEFKVREGNLCAGSVTTVAMHESVVAAIAEHLKLTTSGLFFCSRSYNLILYPAKSDDWSAAMLDVETASTPTTPEGGLLNYLFFSSAFELSPFLMRGPSMPTTQEDNCPDRVAIMDSVFGLGMSTYHSLLPPRIGKRKGKDRFFLLFPFSSGALVYQIVLWLRACDPEAQIYLNAQSGSWVSFLSEIKAAGSSAGCDAAVLIIHEPAIWTLRQVPQLLEFLAGGKYHLVWCWPDKSLSPPSLLPSTGSSGLSLFGIEPVRLFPHGHLFLITPSVLISEPLHVLDLVQHILVPPLPTRTSTRPISALMVATNVVQYMFELAADKASERDAILHRPSSRTVNDREAEASSRGVSVEDCRATFEVAQLIQEALGLSFDIADEQSHHAQVLFVDEAIDANDEQSIVNWFGWWSIAHADQYRKFHVFVSGAVSAGNGNDSKLVTGSGSRPMDPNRSQARRLRLRIPNYRAGTVNDPDFIDSAPQDAAPQDAAPPKILRSILHAEQRSAPTAARPGRSARSDDPLVFQSDLLRSDSKETIKEYLFMLMNRRRCVALARTYALPVLWKDSEESFKHGLIDAGKYQISEWFEYTWPFGRQEDYELYAGFFYTIDDEGGQDKAVRPQRPWRRPWVVIYRSKKPRETELIILDSVLPAAHSSAGSVPLGEDDLPSAQLAVIEHVRAHEHKKRPPQRLKQVWIGSVPPTFQGSPFDRCLRFIDRILDDVEIIPRQNDELERLGYRRVSPLSDVHRSMHEKGQPAPVAATNSDQVWIKSKAGGAPEGTTDDADCKVVFHPPRSYSRPPDTASKCKNHLFEKARLARMRDNNAQTMQYEYQPTLEWYREQVKEDRGFEQLSFDGWEAIRKAARLDM